MTDTPLTESVKPEPVEIQNPVSVPAQGKTEEAAKPADTQSLGDQPASETAGDEGDAKQPSRAKYRIRELSSKYRAEETVRKQAEQDAAYWRERAQKLKPEPVKDRAEYPSDQAFQEAIAEQVATKTLQKTALESEQEANQLALRLRSQAFEARVQEFREKAPDFDQVARNPNLQISPYMGEAITESERGAEVAYYLGKNPNEAARIASLPPIRQAAEIGRLEAQLSIPAKRTTEAPKPVKTVTANVGTGAIDYETASVEDYIRARNAEEAAKRNR